MAEKVNGGEMDFTKQICKELEDRGADVYPVVAGRLGRSKYPDRLVTHRDWMGWLEFKGVTTVLQKAQKLRLERLRRCRAGSAWVVRRRDAESTRRGWLTTPDEKERWAFEGGEELLKLLSVLSSVEQSK